jgi:hypothetical protein
MKLYSQHIAEHPTLEATEWLKQQGYNCDVEATRVVASDSSDNAYVVQKVTTTSVPFERADVAADQTSLVLCSCDDCRYRSFEHVNVEQSLEGFRSCKHGRAEFKIARAQADENQSQLFDTGQ